MHKERDDDVFCGEIHVALKARANVEHVVLLK
jgi:hypothetical protein